MQINNILNTNTSPAIVGDGQTSHKTISIYKHIKIMIAEEQKNKIIVSFHTGRGGRFHNSGYKKYLGEKSFKEIIKENENNIYVKNRDENGKYIKPIIIDGSGNEISDNKINDETGILNFDHDYDTTVSKYIEQCTNEEIELIIKSEIYKSEEINEYIKAFK